MNHLINKYNKAVPRYTSYPPVPFWKGVPTQEKWISDIKESYDENLGLDIYIHIPFCEKLCYYCGCNRTITKNHSVEEPFVNILLKEWSLYVKLLGFTPKINSLHFGGGTPNFLSHDNLSKILSTILANPSSTFIGSIEIDPRTIRPEQIALFNDFNIKRVSLGIQDFDLSVQTAINRHQSFEMVEKVVSDLRSSGVTSINFDLIYGLPNQSIATIEGTFDKVKKLRPDLIAFYSYAHLPSTIKNQKLIDSSSLPDGVMKRELYLTGKKRLELEGYVEIGMDHFALPSSYLYQAMANSDLHRNFMGYVDKKSNILIGLGPTSISDSSLSFAQNNKTLEEYSSLINAGELAIVNGHCHTREDILIQKIIQDLMCNRRISLSDVNKLDDPAAVLSKLSEMQEDGILKIDSNEIMVSHDGMGFVRNIAHCFDAYINNNKKSVTFSKSI